MRTYLRERLRRRPIALALALACSVTMAGCNSGFTNVIETAHSALLPPEDITLSNDVIEALPYAASYIQLQDYSRAVMVLNYDDSGVLKWSAGPHEVIATRYGRVVFTRNINDAPQFTANQQADPLGCVRNTIRANSEANTQANTQANTEFSECQQSWIRDIEVGTPIQNNNQRLQLSSGFNFKAATTTSLTLPNGRTYKAIMLTETLTVQPGSQQFENTFWLEAETGRVIKSHQWLSPKLGFIATEELKAYRGDM